MIVDCLFGGRQHGAIVTESDDPERYDPSVLGRVPNGYQYGYCEDCRTGFRWSVELQHWRPYPGSLGNLPALDDEELEILGFCVQQQVSAVEELLADSRAPEMRRELGHRFAILNGLRTAIAECRYGLPC